MELTEVKQKIKEWEYSFKKQHGRIPSKQDVKDNPEVHKLYSLYKSSKQPSSTSSRPTNEKPKLKRQQQHDQTYNPPLSPKGELGPTPQANGKVLSIFDFRLTPPESSPLKRKSIQSNITETHLHQLPPPRSPMKPILIQTPTKPKSNGLLFKTPTKTRTLTFETPSYLTSRKHQQLPPPSSASVEFVSSPKTPIFGRVEMPEFQVSPSPLKTHRFLGKKLADVYNDSVEDMGKFGDEVGMDMEMGVIEEDESEDNEDMNVEEDGEVARLFKKPKTQKRLTRRVKIAPRPMMEENGFVPTDIQKEVSALDEKERHDLAAYINSDEEEEDDEEDDVMIGTSASPIKRGRKPISANYKRMKINDPRTRNFKRRMARR